MQAFSAALRHKLRFGGVEMRHSMLKSFLSVAGLAIFALSLSTTTAAESVFQKVKRAALEQA